MSEEYILNRYKGAIEILRERSKELEQEVLKLRKELEEFKHYDYYAEVEKDIESELKDEYGLKAYIKDNGSDDYDRAEEYFRDILFNSDGVTGNASGSYFCSDYQARVCLFSNWHLIQKALWNYDNPKFDNPEELDVIIRCYVFDEVYSSVFDVVYNELIENYQ